MRSKGMQEITFVWFVSCSRHDKADSFTSLNPLPQDLTIYTHAAMHAAILCVHSSDYTLAQLYEHIVV